MPHTPIETAGRGAFRPGALGPAARAVTLALATLSTGLVAGVFYAYAVSVNLGLAAQPDASYVSTMRAINERIQNPAFFASFFGAALFGPVALAAHHTGRQRSARFRLIGLACVLYVAGGFLPTVLASVPLNDRLAAVDPGAPARVLAAARDAYEGPWGFWNGVRAVFSVLAFVALVAACLAREHRGRR